MQLRGFVRILGQSWLRQSEGDSGEKVVAVCVTPAREWPSGRGQPSETECAHLTPRDPPYASTAGPSDVAAQQSPIFHRTPVAHGTWPGSYPNLDKYIGLCCSGASCRGGGPAACSGGPTARPPFRERASGSRRPQPRATRRTRRRVRRRRHSRRPQGSACHRLAQLSTAWHRLIQPGTAWHRSSSRGLTRPDGPGGQGDAAQSFRRVWNAPFPLPPPVHVVATSISHIRTREQALNNSRCMRAKKI